MLCHVAVHSILWLLFTANVVPSLLILVTLMMEAIHSSTTFQKMAFFNIVLNLKFEAEFKENVTFPVCSSPQSRNVLTAHSSTGNQK
jgi:hypothetical protein